MPDLHRLVQLQDLGLKLVISLQSVLVDRLFDEMLECFVLLRTVVSFWEQI